MSAEGIAVLGRIAEQRWGLVTTLQAGDAGISRMRLSRLAAVGAIIRVMQGVYRMAGAPELEHEGIIATWLALGGDKAPKTPAGAPGLVVAGIDATLLHGLGDFFPAGHDLIAPARKGTRLPVVRIRIRSLSPEEVTFVDALPILTIEHTIADLVESWTDRSLIADVVRYTITQGGWYVSAAWSITCRRSRPPTAIRPATVCPLHRNFSTWPAWSVAGA